MYQTKPLSGVKVVDLGIITAGAATSAILADLGADVVKLESKSYPDPFRAWPGAKDQDSPFFRLTNRNKRNVDLNLKTEAGRKLFLELVAKADVVVENFSRGVLDRLGLSFDVMKKANPHIILASVTGQGLTGPGSNYVSYGSTLEGVAGVSAITGYPEERPETSGRNLNYPDQIVGLFAAGAIIAVLIESKRTGLPVHIDVSQRQTATFVLGEYLTLASFTEGMSDSLLRRGNSGNHELLQGAYKTKDKRWLTISISTEDQRINLTSVLGLNKNIAMKDLNRQLSGWVAARQMEEAQLALLSAKIAAYPAFDGKQASECEAVQRGTALVCSAGGNLAKGFPFQLKYQTLTIYAKSPKLGEHTDEVLAEWLGVRNSTNVVIGPK